MNTETMFKELKTLQNRIQVLMVDVDDVREDMARDYDVSQRNRLSAAHDSLKSGTIDLDYAVRHISKYIKTTTFEDMNPQMKNVFVYGSYMKGESNHSYLRWRLEDHSDDFPAPIGPIYAKIEGYKRYMKTFRWPISFPWENSEVVGELYINMPLPVVRGIDSEEIGAGYKKVFGEALIIGTDTRVPCSFYIPTPNFF